MSVTLHRTLCRTNTRILIVYSESLFTCNTVSGRLLHTQSCRTSVNVRIPTNDLGRSMADRSRRSADVATSQLASRCPHAGHTQNVLYVDMPPGPPYGGRAKLGNAQCRAYTGRVQFESHGLHEWLNTMMNYSTSPLSSTTVRNSGINGPIRHSSRPFGRTSLPPTPTLSLPIVSRTCLIPWTSMKTPLAPVSLTIRRGWRDRALLTSADVNLLKLRRCGLRVAHCTERSSRRRYHMCVVAGVFNSSNAKRPG